MNFHLSAIACASASLLASHAQAQVALSANLGTTGPGVHLVVPMEQSLNGRFGVSGLKHRSEDSASGVDYDLVTTLQTVDVWFDWYVLERSAFHVTAGVVYNNNTIDARGRPNSTGTYVINDKTYSTTEVATLSGDVGFRKAAPYLGIGWGNPLSILRQWHLMADLGVIYQGNARTRLFSEGCIAAKAVCTALNKDVAQEKAQFAAQMKQVPFYPVLRVGAAYRF